MSNISVKEAIVEILSKSITVEEAFSKVAPGEIDELTYAINLVRDKLTKTGSEAELIKFSEHGQWSLNKTEPLSKPPVSEAQRKAMWAAASGKSNIGIPKSVGKDFAEEDPGGKLPLKKAIKPGPSLNYKEINPKPNFKEMEENAPSIDYGDNRMAAPKAYSGAAAKAKAVRDKIDAESKESAMETIARRQKMNKEEGTNLDDPVADKGRMTAKSEAEPHADDPTHEKKEKKKAKKIKEEAEDLIDMHE